MSDETKVIELRPEQRVLKEAELEHRRCQHSYLFQQLVVAVCTGMGKSVIYLHTEYALDFCDDLAGKMLDRTEEIRKR